MNIFDFAILMENDIERFYKEQAERNKDNSLSTVFLMLAKEEENHANILRANADKLTLPMEDNNILNVSQSIFNDIKPLKSSLRDLPTQLDLYHYALEKEEESVELYKDLHQKATSDKSKTVFTYLIKQEETHCIILEELVKLVERPEAWVESPEFGEREDY